MPEPIWEPSPARGCVAAILAGAVVWAALGALVWLLIRRGA